MQVLVIEDEPIWHFIVPRHLEIAGYESEPTIVTSISEAKAITDTHFDVIFMDGVIQGGRTTETGIIPEFRKKLPNCLLIGFSGRDDILAEQHRQGCQVSLGKPYTIEKLKEVLDNHFRKS